MKRILAAFFVAVLFVFAFTAPSLAALTLPTKPTTDIFVQDYAHLLSEGTRAAILKEGAALDRDTTAQIAVVTIESLNGSTIEDYSIQLARAWGIGQQGKDNGVLILVAKNDHKARIEVGYGLEGRIPDARAGAVLRDMLAKFKQGDYDGGILGAYGALDKLARSEAAATGAAATAPTASGEDDAGVVLAVFGVAILLGVILAVVSAFSDSSYESTKSQSTAGSRPLSSDTSSHTDDHVLETLLAAEVLHEATEHHESKKDSDDDDDSSGGLFGGGGSSGGGGGFSFGGGGFGGGGASGGW